MSKEEQKDLGKFFLVGVVSTVVDYLLLNVFAVWLKFPLLVANSLAAPASSFLSYKLNRHVVFEDRMHGQRKTLLLYALIVGFGILVIQNSLLHVLEGSIAQPIAEFLKPLFGTVHLKLSQGTIAINVAKIGASLVMALWNFYMLRKFVFVTKDDTNA